MEFSGVTSSDPALQAFVQLFFIGVDLVVIVGFCIAFLRLRDRFAIFVLGALFYDLLRLATTLVAVVRGGEASVILADSLGFFRGLSILGAVQVLGGVTWNRRWVGGASALFVAASLGVLVSTGANASQWVSSIGVSLAHLFACVVLLRLRLLDSPGAVALFVSIVLSMFFYGGQLYALEWGTPVSALLYYLLHNSMNVLVWVSLGVIGLDRIGMWLSNARTAIDESEQRFLLVANASTDAILAINRQGLIIDWNSYASECFGWSKRDALGLNVSDVLPGQSPDQLAQRRDRAPTRISSAGTQTFDRFEASGVRKSGTTFPVEVTLVHLPKGGATSLALIVRDITERKEHEKTLVQARDELESLNARLETALGQATDMAASANDANLAKSQFLATMSHEIRTPMNGIIGMTSLLGYTDLKGDQKEYVATIRESCDVLLSIINEILDFSKIEAGQLQLEYQSFDLRRCVEGALDLLGRNASEKGLYLGYQIEDIPSTTIYSDETRLRQILVNLIGNAIKFTEAGGVFVYVGAQNAGEGEIEVTFSVVDSGIGIPPDKRDRLFQPFSQVDPSIARKFGGTGLGLAICSRLCELMGGRIWVESEENVGSTFSFVIRAKEIKSLPPEYLEERQPALVGRYVFLLEGNDRSREIVGSYCRRWGMNLSDGADVESLRSFIRNKGKLDLLLVDYEQMAREKFDLLEARREFSVLGNLPYVVLTSGLVPSQLESDRQCVGVLPRAVKPGRFFALVQSFFEADIAKKGSESSLWRFNEQLGASKPLRILLAEDNLVNQKVALGYLQKMGYRADVAGNGIEVLDAIGRQRYDVILMDVQMPEMGGLEATRRINDSMKAEHRPWIIAMTAGATSEDRERCMDAGMDDFLSKPINAEAFQDVLRRCSARG